MMKYINYVLVIFALMVVAAYVFNHISAWGGIAIGFFTIYFVVNKIAKSKQAKEFQESLKHIKF